MYTSKLKTHNLTKGQILPTAVDACVNLSVLNTFNLDLESFSNWILVSQTCAIHHWHDTPTCWRHNTLLWANSIPWFNRRLLWDDSHSDSPLNSTVFLTQDSQKAEHL